MNVLVVDDEPAMLLAMKRLLAKIDGIKLVGSFQNTSEVLDFVQDNEVDLAFLDIQIASDNGLELARSLRSVRADLGIVFTTSHAEYAMDAYDVYPLDYMVKPISIKRLTETVTRAASLLRHASNPTGEPRANQLMVRGLGCFEVSSMQAGAVKWISKKSMELFAYLIVHRGRSVSKIRILEDVFSEMPLRNAEKYLNTAIYQLRKALSQHGFKEIIISMQEKYCVELNQVEVDFIQFEHAVVELSEIHSANEGEAIELEKLFTGELYEDKSFGWVAAERERLSIVYNSYAKRLARWLLEQDRLREAAHLARRIASYNEFEEESAILLLTIYGTMGDRGSLRHYYEHYTEILLSELGLQPSLLIEQIYERYSK